MARFDVYNLTDTLVVDCQADLLDYLDRRFVVPLIPPEKIPAPIRRLHPQLEIDGRAYIMATHMAASVPVKLLSKRLLSLDRHQDAIAAALDMLLVGF